MTQNCGYINIKKGEWIEIMMQAKSYHLVNGRIMFSYCSYLPTTYPIPENASRVRFPGIKGFFGVYYYGKPRFVNGGDNREEIESGCKWHAPILDFGKRIYGRIIGDKMLEGKI